MTPTLHSFLGAMRSGDVAHQPRVVAENNHNILLKDKCGGAASSALWDFWIGDRFVPVQIMTQLHSLFQSDEFSALCDFKCSTGTHLHMVTQLEALHETPRECFIETTYHLLTI